jgi:hypothetical protein
MAEDYISQFYTWATGNTITAARLNGNVTNLTDGLSGGTKAVNSGKLLIGGTEVITSTRTATITGMTLSGDITTTGTAIDWDLLDNDASALSFDSADKAGILALVTTDGSEGVTMSGTLSVTGNATLSGAVTGPTSISVDNLLIDGNDISTTSGNLTLTPVAGSAVVIDGGASFDGTILTGLTALTSTAITGTLQTAEQTNVTSLGTLTGLTVNSSTITLSQDTNFVLSGGVNGVSFNTDTLSIDATNNRVGIGTTTPTRALDLTSTAAVAIIQASDDSNARLILNAGATSDAKLECEDNGTTIWNAGMDGSDSNKFKFSNSGALETSTRMTLTTGGSLGIGTDSPEGKIHIYESDASAAPAANAESLVLEKNGTNGISILSGTGSQGNIYFGDSGDSDIGYIRYNHSTDAMSIRVNASERMTISSAGAIRLHDYGAGTLVTDASGNVTASSDERLKTNIKESKCGLKEVLGLKPITHKWAKESGMETDGTYLGFSAQNVKENIPLAVSEGENGYFTLSDRGILSALVNAVKELEGKIK